MARADAPAVALDALRRIVRALGVSARTAERSAGVTGAQLFVLQKLREAPAHSLNDLADRTFTHQSTVSVVVDRLVARGLVARTRSAADARRIELTLTAHGRKALRRAPPAAQSRLVAALKTLPGRECETLARALRSIVKRMDLPGGPAAMFFETATRQPSGPMSPSLHQPRHRRLTTASKRDTGR
jgi:DNA-binding MarR family transcriptional regulator